MATYQVTFPERFDVWAVGFSRKVEALNAVQAVHVARRLMGFEPTNAYVESQESNGLRRIRVDQQHEEDIGDLYLVKEI